MGWLRARARIARVFSWAITAGWLSTASVSSAHAPPEISRVVWHPEGDRVALMTSRGVMFGEVNGGSWRLLCGAGLGLSDGEEADVAYLKDGRLLVATRAGLRSTRNEGCDRDWVAPFMNTVTTALTQVPARPDTLYLGVSSVGQSGIHVSRDSGASWVRALVLPDGSAISRFAVAPSTAGRVYATAVLARGAAVLLRSSDSGASWEEERLPLRADEPRAPSIAVCPLDPDLVLILAVNREPGVTPDRLLVSRDGGRTLEELWSSIALREVAFGPDGKRAWIAGLGGLWHTDDALREVMKHEAAQLTTCIGAHAGSLYTCGHYAEFNPVTAGLGASDDDGATFRSVMSFTDVMEPVMCSPASQTLAACREVWADWQLEILVSLGGAPISILDAGVAPIADGGSARSTTPPSSSAANEDSGCGVVYAGAPTRTGWTAWILALALVALGVHRTRRRAP